MGYAKLVNSNINTAFRKLQDFTTAVTLSKATNNGFDFATNKVSSASVEVSQIRGFILNSKREQTDKPASSKTISMLFKAKELPDPTIYDTLTMSDGSVWKIIPPYLNDGFTITLNIART